MVVMARGRFLWAKYARKEDPMRTLNCYLTAALLFACANRPDIVSALDVPDGCIFEGHHAVGMKLIPGHCQTGDGTCVDEIQEQLWTDDLDHPRDDKGELTGETCAGGEGYDPAFTVERLNGADVCVLRWNRRCDVPGVGTGELVFQAVQRQGSGRHGWTGTAELNLFYASGQESHGDYDLVSIQIDAPLLGQPLSGDAPELYSTAQTEAICNPIETGIGWAQFYSGLSNCCQVSTTQWHCVGASSFCDPNNHTTGMNVNVSCHTVSGGNDTACETFTDNAAHTISRMKCVCSTSTGSTSCSFVGSCSC